MAARLVYIFDAYCGWCYGFSPTITELAADPTIDIEVIHGSLFAGSSEHTLGNIPHIPAANQRITELTGAQFGEAYQALFEEGSLVMNSNDAARGLNSLLSVGKADQAVAYAAAMQKAFYLEGQSLSDIETYRAIAQIFGLDAEALAAAFTSPAIAQAAQAGQQWITQVGISSYPTLLCQTPQGLVQVANATSTAADVKATLAQLS